MSDTGSVPQRWLHCPRKSNGFIVNKFIAFKTPLSSAYRSQMNLQDLFEPSMLFDYIKLLNARLGLWIDLTKTTRYYDRTTIEEKGVQYIKLSCQGHGETPTMEQTQAFIEIVTNFVKKQPLDLIGVHCTHGFNRTGFLIISYLVERLDFTVETAIATFAEVRPPGIYKQDYIDELYKRYDPSAQPQIAPEIPDWSMEEDFVESVTEQTISDLKRKRTSYGGNNFNDSESVNDILETDSECSIQKSYSTNDECSNSGIPPKSKRRMLVIKNAQFMEGVPGVEWIETPSIVQKLQKIVKDMCGYIHDDFPGAQPVSMDRDNIEKLKTDLYRVSWKADGTRYMMLILKQNEIYFFDRNNSCFKVHNLTFVKANNINDHLENTLVDGEMVLDKYNGEVTPRYLIYDIIKICNEDIGQKPFPVRLKCIEKNLIAPRHRAIMAGIINRSEEPFGVRFKNFWEISRTSHLLSDSFTKSLTHEPDGLIYQPVDKPYTPGVCPDILKWKPQSLNSIDFRLKIGYESGVGILKKKVGFLYVGGLNPPYTFMPYTQSISQFDQKIIECSFSPKGWQFLRVRTDKCLPNSLQTAQAIVKSIQDCVEKDYLLRFIDLHGCVETNTSHIRPETSTSQQPKKYVSNTTFCQTAQPPPKHPQATSSHNVKM